MQTGNARRKQSIEDPEAWRWFRGGKLERMPRRPRDRRHVLRYIARSFEPGRVYAEPEVNRILGAYSEDHAALRRHLADAGFLHRAGGIYRRAPGLSDTAPG